MKTMLSVLFVLATCTVSAQTFQDLKLKYPGIFSTQVKKTEVSVYEKPDYNFRTQRILRMNEIVLVYDSTETFYCIAKQKEGAIGFVPKGSLLTQSEANHLRQKNLDLAKSSVLPAIANTKYKVNGAGIVFAVVSAGLAWDFASDASDYKKSIDEAKKLNIDTRDLESTQTRKRILAIICGAGAIAGVIFSIETVTIEPIEKGIALNYSVNF